MGRLTPQMLGRLLEEHGPALELFARQWCDCPEDVLQDALLKLVTLKKPPEKAIPWLYRVVRNAAISASRSANRRRRRERAASGMNEEWFVPSADDVLDARAAVEALRTLPVDQSEAIVARIWGGLTFEEIARVTGCGSSTAHRRYVAGLSVLRERLGVSCSNKKKIET